jgi:glycosyltransferase involved in cell wall biosynthesis
MRSRAEIHLRGNASPAFEAWLRARAPQSWHSRLFIHPLVSNSELHSRIAEHDIGFAGEQTYCRSRDLTVTNKILSYMLAGLAVVASDTAGQREVAELAPAAISLYRPGDARELARTLDDLLSSPAKLSRAKAQALQAAEQRFCWEKQEPILVESVGRALAAA